MTDDSETPPAATPPLFIVGCGRSGTTLLRMMLNAHPDLSIPQESHVIYRIARLMARGQWPESVATEAGWGHLVDYLAETPYLDAWEFDRAPIRARLEALDERTHAAAFRSLFEEYIAQFGGRRWADKTPQHVQYMLILNRLFPDAQFVHVTRDGRDVALSLLQMNWGPHRMAEAGYYWEWLVLSGIVSGALLGPERYTHIRYEDLVTNTGATLRALSGWLGHEYCDDMLTYYASEEAHAYAEMHWALRGGEPAGARHPITTPPDPSQLQKWRERMDPGQLRSFLRQAGGLLAHLGYETDALPGPQEAFRDRLEALLEPGVLPAMAADLPPIGGSKTVRTGRLLATRATQLAALLAQRPSSFARASLRWQTTVADLLL